MRNSWLKQLLLPLTLVATTATAAETQWRQLDVDNTLLMTLPHGQVVVELAPQFAPAHVKQFKQLVNDKFYQDSRFYRVIDGFVAQGGPEQEDKDAPTLKIEGEWTAPSDQPFTLVQQPDLFAEQTGFINGFAAAQDSKGQQRWLAHCHGVLAMARGNEPDTASSHFYFTNGQAPRYLDRIMTIFGRVVYGMEHIQAIQRTTVIEGDAEVDKARYTPIVNMALMANVPAEQQIIIEVEDTNSAAFKEKLVQRRTRPSAFFYQKPPQVLDVCQVPVNSRRIK